MNRFGKVVVCFCFKMASGASRVYRECCRISKIFGILFAYIHSIVASLPSVYVGKVIATIPRCYDGKICRVVVSLCHQWKDGIASGLLFKWYSSSSRWAELLGCYFHMFEDDGHILSFENLNLKIRKNSIK